MKEDKKAAAHTLYMDDYEQRIIASILGITEKTISTWVNDGEWAVKRASKQVAEQSIRDDALFILNRLLKAQREILESDPTDENGRLRLPDTKLADAVHKLYSVVKDKEVPWHQTARTVTELLKYITSQDLNLAKQLQHYCKLYLEHKRQEA